MDDYLSKPVEPDALREIVLRWVKADSQTEPAHPPVQPARQTGLERAAQDHASQKVAMVEEASCQETEVFDLATLRSRVEGDLDLLAEIIGLYLDNSPRLLEEIESAVAAQDSERIARAAHTLKGMLKNMCAAKCVEAALEVETLGRKNDFALASRSLPSLKDECAQLASVLTEVAKEVAV
jgi:HPt (histidine-containing phosphotransfer) domain-containing protein